VGFQTDKLEHLPTFQMRTCTGRSPFFFFTCSSIIQPVEKSVAEILENFLPSIVKSLLQEIPELYKNNQRCSPICIGLDKTLFLTPHARSPLHNILSLVLEVLRSTYSVSCRRLFPLHYPFFLLLLHHHHHHHHLLLRLSLRCPISRADDLYH